ncbi:MAG: rhomboid family intramembrane serine protease [Pseudonocardiales bacterium]|nr:MAG: rhomboid family intramembrane serine protease [Pseudonocardiales bacterium]
MTQEATPQGDRAAAPVCYRHRDRETYVRCVRCDRPICPDCMNAASVGFQCPECVRAGNRSIRPARTTFGGRVSGRDNAITIGLIGINVAVFLLAAATNPRALTSAIPTTLHDRFALVGALVAHGEYYRLITSAFLHYGPLHIAFNMYALWLFGQELERLYGRVRFIGLYLVSALGGSALAYLIINPNAALAGASGAVFGLFGAYFVTARKIGLSTGGILALVAINLVLGFVIPGIGWQAHIGGLITGTAMAAVLAYAPRGPRRLVVQIGGTVAIVAVLCVVVVLRTAALTG